MPTSVKRKPSKKATRLTGEEIAYYRMRMERIIDRLTSESSSPVLSWKGIGCSLRGRMTVQEESAVDILRDRAVKLFSSTLLREYEGRNADAFKQTALEQAREVFDSFVSDGTISPIQHESGNLSKQIRGKR